MVSTQLDSYFGIIEERVTPEGYNPTADTTAYIINNDGTSTTLWKWVDASGSAGECTTGELTLIGSLTGVLATGDFTFTGA